jgi:putative inorganic carbon (hco3(-)) transporter
MKSYTSSIVIWGILALAILVLLGDNIAFIGVISVAIFARFIMLFSLERLLLLALFLTLPFSMELLVTSSSKMAFPSEILLVLLFCIFSYNLFELPPDKRRLFYTNLLPNPLVLSIVLFLMIMAVSTYFSTMPIVSFKFALVNLLFVSVGCGYTILLVWLNKIKVRELIAAAVVGLSLIAAYTVVNSFILGFGRNVAPALPKPFYNDHTHLAATLLLMLPLVFFLWKTETQKWGRTSYSIALFLFAVGLIVTYSRASWLGALLMLLVGAVWFFKIKTPVVVVTAFSVLFLLIVNSSRIENYFQINRNDSNSLEAGIGNQLKSVTNITSDVSNLERLNRWKCALRMGQDKPIVGYGPGTYQFQYIPFQRKNELTIISVKSPFDIKDGRGGTAHSEYLLAFSESGYPGLIGWIALIYAVIVTFYSIFRSSHNKEDMLLAQMCFMGLIGFFVHAFFNNFLNSANFAVYFWFIIGILAFLSHQNRIPRKV